MLADGLARTASCLFNIASISVRDIGGEGGSALFRLKALPNSDASLLAFRLDKVEEVLVLEGTKSLIKI